MNSTLIIICLLGLLMTGDGFAQDDNEPKKKPSWSTGLPERQVKPSMDQPEVQVDQPAIDIEQAEIEVERPNGLAIETEFQTDFTLPQIEISSIKDDEDEPQVEYEVFSAADIDSQYDYDWQIEEMRPVKIPKTLSFSYQNVMLEVSINPKGEVVKVKRVSDRTSNVILNYATQTMKKHWKFSAPEAVGITGIITKIMSVDLVSR